MRDFIIESSICVKDRPIKEYRDNQGNTWIEAREGSAYSIRIKNNSYCKKLVIVSVDGINVITGKPAVREPKDGYIVDGYKPIVIEGWRINNDKVKEFVFSFNKDKCYAVKLGEGKENLGVIGIIVYAEQVLSTWTTTPNITYDWGVRDTGNSSDWSFNPRGVTCQSFGSNYVDFSCEVQTAGTAKGNEIKSIVTEVSFNAGQLVSEQIFYYDSWENLKKKGIITVKRPGLPQPFTDSRFCPDI